MKRYIKPLMAVLVFMAMQAATSLVIVMSSMLLHNGESDMNSQAGIMAWALILSGVLSIALCIKPLGLIRIKKVFGWRDIRWRHALSGIAACVCGVFGMNLLTELMHLPNLMQDDLTDMMHCVPGIMAIAVVGPITEELIFREALMGGMIRQGVRPWTAMILSSLLFGIIHFNPAQVPGAAFIGMMLAIVYWQTGNALLPVMLHITNNSICVIQVLAMGPKINDFRMTDWVGGTTMAWALIVVSGVACVLLAKIFIQNYPHNGQYPEKNV